MPQSEVMCSVALAEGKHHCRRQHHAVSTSRSACGTHRSKNKSTSFEVLLFLVTRGGIALAFCKAENRRQHNALQKASVTVQKMIHRIIFFTAFDSPFKVWCTKKQTSEKSDVCFLVTRGGIEPPLLP